MIFNSIFTTQKLVQASPEKTLEKHKYRSVTLIWTWNKFHTISWSLIIDLEQACSTVKWLELINLRLCLTFSTKITVSTNLIGFPRVQTNFPHEEDFVRNIWWNLRDWSGLKSHINFGFVFHFKCNQSQPAITCSKLITKTLVFLLLTLSFNLVLVLCRYLETEYGQQEKEKLRCILQKNKRI